MKQVIRRVDGELVIDDWDEDSDPLMECGCTAQGICTLPAGEDGNKPTIRCCVIHDGEKSRVVAEKPSLEGRKARCSYGGSEVDSDYGLAFFKHRPDKDTDEYYCGCYGWN